MGQQPRPRSRSRSTRKLWGGVFRRPTAPIVDDFTASLPVDKRLYPYDILGSIAHCHGLVRAGVLRKREGAQLIAGLRSIKRELDQGTFQFDRADEDIHTAIDRRLTERVGAIGQKLHAGRSRNDQIVLDVRLYLRDEVEGITTRLAALQEVLLGLATDYIGHILPGYTHLQRAQPLLLSHHLLAYYDMFGRDTERFEDCRRRSDLLPLGAGALAGTGFATNRRQMARELGFRDVTTNSVDAVADRDDIAEFLGAAAILVMHLSRLGNEIVLWSSAEFGFVELPDAFATGSSMMPQKRNPDVAELLRGKTGRVYGDLIAVLVLLKDLPLAYNRDLQEDKPPLFDAADTVRAALDVTTAMLPQLTWNTARMRAAADDDLLMATDLADALVERGVPFREAHEIVGRLVAASTDQGRRFRDFDGPALQKISPHLEPALLRRLTPEASVDRRRVVGGTAPSEVRRRLRELKQATALSRRSGKAGRRSRAP